MSSENIAFELQNAEYPVPSTTPVAVLNIKNATWGKQAVLMYVLGDPDTYAKASNGFDQATAFAKGCLAIDTSNATLKVNTNASAPDWAEQV